MKSSKDDEYDLCVIGGGINGAGIARDAAGRGLKVVLLEAEDLASATSSSTSKMLHGGLRYLEYYEFSMVREALREREIIMDLAPHISRPMEFVLPDSTNQRPSWMIRAGLFLYDHLAGRKKLKASKRLNLDDGVRGAPLKHAQKGFSYSDAMTDDARLVVLNAMSAREKGAQVLTHAPCTGLVCEEGAWRVSYGGADEDKKLRARAVVNAAGPFVSRMLERAGLGQSPAKRVRLVKGSHIIVPRQYEGDHSYLLQQPDGRVVFVWPYQNDFTLIGTTEEDYEGNPRDAEISATEESYLIDAYNAMFAAPIKQEDIVWRYSGVRPLFDDGADNPGAVTRDFHIHHHQEFEAPLYSIYGGKLTTYRAVAQAVVDKITGENHHWTQRETLPGGDIPNGDINGYVQAQTARYSWLPGELTKRYAQTYGTRMDKILEGAAALDDLGAHYGASLYDAELRYLVAEEFAKASDDILWRRTKLGLKMPVQAIEGIEKRMLSL